MKRVKLTIAYDGTAYCGWQIQPNGITVQEVLNTCLSDLLKEKIRTIGASRTDSGVHARGNVAVFDTAARIPGEKISYALNTCLPPDIRITDSREVARDFHPRYTETVKTYQYQILNRRFPDPTRRLYSTFCYMPLDMTAMSSAIRALPGEHDFAAFQASGSREVRENTIRTIYDVRLEKENDMIIFTITGNGFLYHMVRIIAGTLMEIGKGGRNPEDMAGIIASRDHGSAGPTAPAEGLTLLSIRYPLWEPDFLREDTRSGEKHKF